MKSRALLSLAPLAQFSLTKDSEGTQILVWHSTDIKQPTDAEVDAEVERLVIADIKRTARNEVTLSIVSVEDEATGHPTKFDMAGWAEKRLIAESARDGLELTQTQIADTNLEISVRGKGETFETFNAKVLANVQRFTKLERVLSALKSKYLSAIEECETQEQADAIIDECHLKVAEALGV